MPESVFKLDDNSLDPVSRSTIEERETIAPVLSPEERINARREAWRNLNPTSRIRLWKTRFCGSSRRASI
jgi:hypothetical protein